MLPLIVLMGMLINRGGSSGDEISQALVLPSETIANIEPTVPIITETIVLSPTQTIVLSPTQTETLVPSPTYTPDVLLGIGPSMINPIDGSVMVHVPAGGFLMGSQDEDAFINEAPEQRVYLDSFWLFQTEVTNSQFNAFVNETGYFTTAEKKRWSWIFRDNQWDKVEGAYWQAPQGPASDIAGFEQHPVVHVSWFDAAAYCEWAGGRLPTEAEWEKAARGVDGARYPWGNSAPTCLLANFGACKSGSVRVGSHPEGASPYGALDMAGNVWEWVSDWYDEDYYADAPAENPTGPSMSDFKGLRGGSWARYSGTLRTSYRGRAFPGDSYNLFGFRCVYTGQP